MFLSFVVFQGVTVPPKKQSLSRASTPLEISILPSKTPTLSCPATLSPKMFARQEHETGKGSTTDRVCSGGGTRTPPMPRLKATIVKEEGECSDEEMSGNDSPTF